MQQKQVSSERIPNHCRSKPVIRCRWVAAADESCNRNFVNCWDISSSTSFVKTDGSMQVFDPVLAKTTLLLPFRHPSL